MGTVRDKKKDQLSIAMIGHKRIPSREGGIEIVVEELSTRMIERGHSVTAYNRKGHHVSGKEFDNHNNKNYIRMCFSCILCGYFDIWRGK